MAKELKYLIIHYSETREGQEVTGAEIKDWHMDAPPMGNGWSRPGYSDIMHLDGSLENLTPFNSDDVVDPWEVSYGAKGFNGCSRHICYIGGLREEIVDDYWEPADTRTPDQLYGLEVYCRYMILRHPKIQIGGHNQFSGKTCPGFNVPKWLEEIGIPERNIYRGKG
jgi:N-acetylmuramoyl-L-alanine amidase